MLMPPKRTRPPAPKASTHPTWLQLWTHEPRCRANESVCSMQTFANAWDASLVRTGLVSSSSCPSSRLWKPAAPLFRVSNSLLVMPSLCTAMWMHAHMHVQHEPRKRAACTQVRIRACGAGVATCGILVRTCACVDVRIVWMRFAWPGLSERPVPGGPIREACTSQSCEVAEPVQRNRRLWAERILGAERIGTCAHACMCECYGQPCRVDRWMWRMCASTSVGACLNVCVQPLLRLIQVDSAA